MKSTKLSSIKRACEINDVIFSKLICQFDNFNSELEIEHFILSEIRQRNLKPAFYPIIATGKNAAIPHHKANGSWYPGFLVMDFGVKVNGFCSDMTRTIFIGKPGKVQRELYDVVLNAQKKCVDMVEPGIVCKDVAHFNKKLLGKHWKKMKHKLGHGVGKKIHILPRVSFNSKHKLKKGEVITIEPGVYYKGRYGIRIEDTLVVGGSVLTKSSKKLIVKKFRG
ncbi:MAG: M24 family metallopeptidase [Nanoarchaeota archaeon]|nr:M24 family metallopeptidase [Nanoarchaeota archaeon]